MLIIQMQWHIVFLAITRELLAYVSSMRTMPDDWFWLDVSSSINSELDGDEMNNVDFRELPAYNIKVLQLCDEHCSC
jgi:hypothetical protein